MTYFYSSLPHLLFSASSSSSFFSSLSSSFYLLPLLLLFLLLIHLFFLFLFFFFFFLFLTLIPNSDSLHSRLFSLNCGLNILAWSDKNGICACYKTQTLSIAHSTISDSQNQYNGYSISVMTLYRSLHYKDTSL